MYLDQDGKRWFRGNLHTHSTVSDGLKTPDEVIRIYRNEGYDFLAFTDHWKPSGSGEKDGLLLIPGCEYDAGGNAADGIYHIVAIGPDHLVLPEPGPENTAQGILDAIHEAGGFAILAHPAWSLNLPSEIVKLRGINASEIFNSVSNNPWNGRRGESSVILDMVATLGMPLPLVASDDSHFYTGEQCTNFIWLQADDLTEAAVMDALFAGRFYASQGPKMDVRWDGKTVKVRCTPAQQVIFYSNVVYTSPRVSKGFGLTETEYTPLDWETFIRVEVIDANGKMAWSSPIDLRK